MSRAGLIRPLRFMADRINTNVCILSIAPPLTLADRCAGPRASARVARLLQHELKFMPAVKKQVVRNARRPRKQAAAPSHADADPRIVIMDAAERLCAERGLEAVSVRDIVAEAGVNLASINYYFGSRNNLLVAILK